MKLGVLTNLMGDKPLEEVLAYLKPKGVEAVEIGCGGFPGKAHADPAVLLSDETKLQEFKDLFYKIRYGNQRSFRTRKSSASEQDACPSNLTTI